jgi:hypothetical protein
MVRPEGHGGLEIDDWLETGRLQHPQISGLLALDNAASIDPSAAIREHCAQLRQPCCDFPIVGSLTHDGDLIFAHYPGRFHGQPDVMSRLTRGEDVDPSEYYFRVAPLFETASEKYDWLNRVLVIGVGPGHLTRSAIACMRSAENFAEMEDPSWTCR